MDDRDRNLICVNLNYLCEKTAWNLALGNALVNNGVFSQRMMDDITKSLTPVRTMYQKACKRGPNAFDSLVQSLVQSNNTIPAQKLKPTLQHIALSGGKVWNAPVYASQPSYVPVYPTRSPQHTRNSVDNAPPCQFFKSAGSGDSLAPNMVLQATPSQGTTARLFKVRPAKQMTSTQKYPMSYPMTKRPRGQCLIVNNEVFDHMKERRGSSADAANLKYLFTDLGFEVTVKPNLAEIDVKRQVRQFAQSEAHSKAQMSVVVVLSHGGNGFVYGTDGRRCENEWILKQFNNESCPDLKDKPKFFIFQACRGDDEDKGVIERFALKEPEMFLLETCRVETDASGFVPRRTPTWTDMLIAYATVPGYVANRDIYRGSWFVESICKVFAGQAAEKDIREMMDEVSTEMQNFQSEGPDGSMQSSTYEVRGSFKKLFFNPGLYEEETVGTVTVPTADVDFKLKEMELGPTDIQHPIPAAYNWRR